ncbi:iron-containing alcohol dehydrogenase [uncultured Roseobacter sp.]|uniref:iron-containing alcohol dehydrogenase n=1 Tax=uncultured Roseobacter sp. TaxID=114847 RepID=UPI0026206414|nr:iron-containing alcohol dehydrogenase [uncultured Roseobacter sp.]
MLQSFSFLTSGRIVFGRGSATSAGDAVLSFGSRVLLVRGRSVSFADELAAGLRQSGADVTECICSTEPTVTMVQEAISAGRSAACDVVVAVGGGAVVDLGKAAAALIPGQSDVPDHLEGVGHGLPLAASPLPFVALPTTSGTGAEVTKNAVIAVPEAGRKVSLRDDRMLPDVAIIDPALTDGSPRFVTLAAGLDAVTQVIEPYLCNRANPLTDALCVAAIPSGLQALAKLERGEDPEARDEMAFCSLSGGLALANAGLGAVHGLAGVLGGRLGAPHGLICGRLLGPVLTENRACLARMGADLSRFDMVEQAVGQAFGLKSDVFSQLTPLLDSWEIPRLGQWTRENSDLGAIAAEAATASSMKANPCELPEKTLISIMESVL